MILIDFFTAVLLLSSSYSEDSLFFLIKSLCSYCKKIKFDF